MVRPPAGGFDASTRSRSRNTSAGHDAFGTRCTDMLAVAQTRATCATRGLVLMMACDHYAHAFVMVTVVFNAMYGVDVAQSTGASEHGVWKGACACHPL